MHGRDLNKVRHSAVIVWVTTGLSRPLTAENETVVDHMHSMNLCNNYYVYIGIGR